MPGWLGIDDVVAAAGRIAPFVARTPTLRFEEGGSTFLFKAECLQPIGAFKLRGAFSMMTTLDDCPGVVAHSSGNHAQAVARAARILGLPAVIVMPRTAPEVKIGRTRLDGPEVIMVGPDSEERATRAAEVARERGFVLVPPFDHPLVAAGQGTAALEMLDDVGPIDRFYAPISGGGLMAGCAIAVEGRCPAVELVAVEPETGDDWRRSLIAGERVAVAAPRTIADGLGVRTPGAGPWSVLASRLGRVELVTDDELLEAMAWAAQNLRLVLEPSGAASLAVARRDALPGRSGVLLSGGNVSSDVLARILMEPQKGS